ncbi:MAG: hypothetical protein ACLQNE_25600 [Thermoguttaceae bacterium]
MQAKNVPIDADGRPFEKELGGLFKTAGFGLAWVRLSFSLDAGKRAEQVAKAKREVAWYHSLGIRTVLQFLPEWKRLIVPGQYEATGRALGTEFKGLVAAMGNWAIETANSESPFRGGGKERLTDDEYDTIVAGLYDGIKAADPTMTVLIGNIATDPDAKTVRRIYGKPAQGRFDGAIINACTSMAKAQSESIEKLFRNRSNSQGKQGRSRVLRLLPENEYGLPSIAESDLTVQSPRSCASPPLRIASCTW